MIEINKKDFEYIQAGNSTPNLRSSFLDSVDRDLLPEEAMQDNENLDKLISMLSEFAVTYVVGFVLILGVAILVARQVKKKA